MTRKDIPGFEGKYAATNDGHIWSYRTKRLLKEQTQWAGYKIVSVGHSKAVHRLVAAAWLTPPPTNRHQINHIDGDKANNAPANLEWATASANIKHALSNGLSRVRYGEDTSGAKLTITQVSEIKRLLAGATPQNLIAKIYGLHQSTISLIKSGKRWGKGQTNN